MTQSIEDLRGLLERATPGPWSRLDQYINTPHDGALPIASGWYDYATMEGGQHHDAALANAALIVAAVNALPGLLDQLDASTRALEEARAALEPFARLGELIELETEGFADDDELSLIIEDGHLLARFQVANFRRARSILSGGV